MNNIKNHRTTLDQALLKGPKQLKRFMRQHHIDPPPTDELLEITFHKTITASTSLPIELRRQSKAWLTQRHYSSIDDGDL